MTTVHDTEAGALTGSLELTETPYLALPESRAVEKSLAVVEDFKSTVHNRLIEGVDYGTIPGTGKPTLLQPGAQKICQLLQLRPKFDPLQITEDWDKPLFSYTYKCILVHIPSGHEVAECISNCNSMEARYRWRNTGKRCPDCGQESIRKSNPQFGTGWYCNRKAGGCGASYAAGDPRIAGQPEGRAANDDIFSLLNTLHKMSQKRGLVGATLFIGRLEDVFTQDLEDLPSSTFQPSDDRLQPPRQQPRQTQRPDPATTPAEPQRESREPSPVLARLRNRLQQEGVGFDDFQTFLGYTWPGWVSSHANEREAAVAAWQLYEQDKADRATGCTKCGGLIAGLGKTMCAACEAYEDDIFAGEGDMFPEDNEFEEEDSESALV